MHNAFLRPPNIPRVFFDGAVAGKFSGARDIQDSLPRPLFRFGVKFAQSGMGFAVTLEVRQMEEVVPVTEKSVDYRSENARFMLAEMIARDEIERCAGLGLVII